MMERFSKAEKQKIETAVRDDFSGGSGKSKVEKGLDLLVKLINCTLENQMDDDGLAIRSSCAQLGDDVPPRYECVEGIMKRLIAIREKKGIPLGTETAGRLGGIADYYCKLDIYPPLKAAYRQHTTYNRNKDLHEVINNDKPRPYIPKSDKVAWDTCSLPYAYVYVCAFRMRNQVDHWERLESDDKTLAKRTFFSVLIALCLREERLIESYYSEEMDNLVKRFFSESKKQLRQKNEERIKFFEEKFTELAWGIDGKTGLSWNDKDRVILLIGEAGAGKSTQMEKLYLDDVCEEKANRLPMWIKIQDLKEKDLMDEIRDRLNEYKNSCEELLAEGYISLYLDGLNELLVADQGTSMKNLLLAIENLIENCPKLRICITDRTSQRFSKKLDNEVMVYKCDSMDEDSIWDYCIKYWGDADAEKIIEAVSPDDESNLWFWNDEKHLVIPEKVNGLAEMVLNGKKPKGKADYYRKYVEHILLREERDKKDARIPTLELLLMKLTQKMEFALDAKGKLFITDLFKEDLNNDIERAQEYFVLACQIPMLVECVVEDKSKYLFTYYGYYDYFKPEED